MVQTVLQEQILEKLNTLIVVINLDGKAEYVSDSACRLLGYNYNELLGDNWWEMTRFSKPEGEETRQRILSAMMNSRNTSEIFEHEFRTANGISKWINWQVSFLNDEQIIGIGQDITEKKHNEKQLMASNKRLLLQNKEMLDSINCAQRIQRSSLQSMEYIRSVFPLSFVLYQPKDILSGDFYFFHEDSEYKYAFAVDCTGHGVPGAMMSMVANSIIKEVMLNKKIKAVSRILYELDKELFKAINSYNDEISREGMDISLVSINKKTGRLHFAGAFRPITIIRNGQVMELRASRFPLGYLGDLTKLFEEQVILLEPGDTVYMFSDGYIDQFGGENGKKLNRRNFRELLQLAAEMDIEEQEAFLEYSLNNWKQDHEQTDDVLVIGLRI